LTGRVKSRPKGNAFKGGGSGDLAARTTEKGPPFSKEGGGKIQVL